MRSVIKIKYEVNGVEVISTLDTQQWSNKKVDKKGGYCLVEQWQGTLGSPFEFEQDLSQLQRIAKRRSTNYDKPCFVVAYEVLEVTDTYDWTDQYVAEREVATIEQVIELTEKHQTKDLEKLLEISKETLEKINTEISSFGNV